MTALVRFLVFNVLVSLVVGWLAWLVVSANVRLLALRSAPVSFCFLALPLFKSLFLILGVGFIFAWPGQLFATWHALAVPFDQLWPWLLLWAVAVFLIFRLAVGQARRVLRQDARPAAGAAPRLAAAFESVVDAYHKSPRPSCANGLCSIREAPSRPKLLVSERLDSPLALTVGSEPAILFPAGLIAQLDDQELACALAHEMAHFYLRRRDWCSVGTLQFLTLLNPAASLAGEYLHRQEEEACDDLAVTVVGQPELYAGMLTKSYRFARQHANRALAARLNVVPRLVGFRPLLSERVERLLAPRSASVRSTPSPIVIWLVWAGLFALLFFSWSR